MLSAVISALLLVLTIAIVTGFIISGWREHLRHKKMFLQQQASAVTYPLTQSGMPAYTPPFLLPASWYTRRRTLVSLGFLLMVVLTLCLQDGLTEGSLRTLSKGIGSTFLNASQASDVQSSAHATPIPVLPATASVRLVRIDSGARNQYHTDYQWQVWSYSSCSGIAMTMVMNAYGRHLVAADVLQEELNLGAWDVYLGLLREEGIAMTASYYGFDTIANHTRKLSDLLTLSNKGMPIIVGVRDSYYYPGGHLFVVRGGDDQYVYIADSSHANFQRMSHSMFLNMWQGFSAVLTPRQ